MIWEKKEIIAMLTPHIINAQKIKQMGEEIDSAKNRQKDAGIGQAPDLWWWMK